MQFSIQREDLLNALNAVIKATTSKGIQPILANVLITTVDTKSITLSATDLDISIETTIPAIIEKDGKVTLSAKKLFEIVSSVSDKKISFSLDTEKMITKISSAQAKFDLLGIAADDFPTITKLDESKEVSFELVQFLKNIKQTIFAAAAFESNNVLSGVFCKVVDDAIEFASTDGNRLARSISKLKNPSSKDFTAIIPARVLSELLRIASGKSEKNINVAVDEGQISFRLSDVYILSRLLEGKYPDYPRLIPSNYETFVLAKREELLSCVKRTAIMANERTNIIKIDIEKHKLLFTANTPDMGDASDELEVDYKGSSIKIAFNYKFIIDALSSIDTELVKMEIGGSLSPALFKPEDDQNYLCLVMPVQVK